MGGQHQYFGRLGTVRGDPLLVHFECTFAAGSPFVDRINSDPGITITRDAAGDYDVAGLPTGKLLHPIHMTLDLASDTPADTTVGYAQPRSCNAGAGTCKVLTFARDDGDQDDPPDGARLSATFLVSDNGAKPISSPLEIQGLKAWFADDVTGAGTAGFQVTDLSGNGNHGTQTTVGNQPASSGGVLDFSAGATVNYQVDGAAVSLSGAAQFTVVWRMTAAADIPASTETIFVAGAGSAFCQLSAVSGNVIVSQSGVQTIIPGASVLATNENVYSYVFDNGARTIRLNGETIASASGGSATLGVVGTLFVGTNETQTGGVDATMRHFFIIVGRVPTEAELRFLETYVE